MLNEELGTQSGWLDFGVTVAANEGEFGFGLSIPLT